MAEAPMPPRPEQRSEISKVLQGIMGPAYGTVTSLGETGEKVGGAIWDAFKANPSEFAPMGGVLPPWKRAQEQFEAGNYGSAALSGIESISTGMLDALTGGTAAPIKTAATKGLGSLFADPNAMLIGVGGMARLNKPGWEANLDRARTMEHKADSSVGSKTDYTDAAKRDPVLNENIWRNTGLYKGQDNLYRTEIDTTAFKVKSPDKIGAFENLADARRSQLPEGQRGPMDWGEWSGVQLDPDDITERALANRNAAKEIRPGHYTNKIETPWERTTWSDFFSFPELEKAYPGLKGIELDITILPKDTRGYSAKWSPPYKETPGKITIRATLANLRKAALHEAQHYIQRQEMFGRGSSVPAILARQDDPKVKQWLLDAGPEMRQLARDNLTYADELLLKYPRAKAFLDRVPPSRGSGPLIQPKGMKDTSWGTKDDKKIAAKIDQLRSDAISINAELLGKDSLRARAEWIYGKFAGEIEARRVQKRMDYTPEQRFPRGGDEAIFPAGKEKWHGLTIPLKSQIVEVSEPKFAHGGPVYASEILHMAKGGPPDLYEEELYMGIPSQETLDRAQQYEQMIKDFRAQRDLAQRDAAIQKDKLEGRIEGRPKGGSGLTGVDPREGELYRQLAFNFPPGRVLKVANLLTGPTPTKQALKDVIKEVSPRLTTNPKRSPEEIRRVSDIKAEIQRREGVHSLGQRGLTGPQKRTSLQWGPGWEETGRRLGHPSDPEVRNLINNIIRAPERPVTEDILATDGPSFERTYENLLEARRKGKGLASLAGEASGMFQPTDLEIPVGFELKGPEYKKFTGALGQALDRRGLNTEGLYDFLHKDNAQQEALHDARGAPRKGTTAGEVRSAEKQLYEAGQDYLKRGSGLEELPKKMYVYRYGKLFGNAPMPFTTNPKFSGYGVFNKIRDRRTGEETPLVKYEVDPQDILAVPNSIRAFKELMPGNWEENEVIIAGDKVTPVSGPRSTDQAPSRAYPIAPRDEWYGDANYEMTGGRIEMMSPDEFLAKARPLEIDEVSRENIDDLKSHIESGRTLDPLSLDATGREDGRHRAHAARELGIEKVPVLVWSPTNKAHGGPIYASEALHMQDGGSVVDLGAQAPLIMADVEYTMPKWERIKEDPIALLAYEPRKITNIGPWPIRKPDVAGYYRPRTDTIAIHPSYTFPRRPPFGYNDQHAPVSFREEDHSSKELEEIAHADSLDVLMHELRHKGLYNLVFSGYPGGASMRDLPGDDEQFIRWRNARSMLRRLLGRVPAKDAKLSHETRVQLQDLKDMLHYPHGEDPDTPLSYRHRLGTTANEFDALTELRKDRYQPRRSDWENNEADFDTWYQTQEGMKEIDQHEQDYAKAQSIALEHIAHRWPGWNYEVPESSPYRSATSTGVGVTEPRLSDVLKKHFDDDQEYQKRQLREERSQLGIMLEDNVREKAEGGIASKAPEARSMFGKPHYMTKEPRLTGLGPGIAGLCGVARNMNRSVVA